MENRIHNITEKTTLGELLEILALGEKPAETPTPKQLRETAGKPVATEERCKVYGNGWAVYENETGRTVVWLPDCTGFTYYFDKPSYKRESYVSDHETLPDGLLVSQPWPLAVTLVGDHHIEKNCMNRTASRKGSKANIDVYYDYEITEEFTSNPIMEAYFSKLSSETENPEITYIRKENLQEMLNNMTEKQRKVFLLYQYGYTEAEIAEKMHMTFQNVSVHLMRAIKAAKRKF